MRLPRILIISILVTGVLALASCGSAHSSTLETREVAATRAGYVCFAILEDGHAIGGNCVKD